MNTPVISVFRCYLLPFLFSAFFHSINAQVFVDASAGGSNDGSSWANAYTDLQIALTNTASGEIWVANGTYKPTTCNPCVTTDLEIAFNIPPGVQLYGGFAGGETALGERDWATNFAILSGDIGVPFDSIDNSYRVLIAENSTSSTVLDGFIIEEGNADGSFGFSAGGGLLIDANPGGTGDIQVRNCTFRNNYGGGGGAIAIDCVLGGVSRAVIRDCVFKGNTASLRVTSTGAAIFMQGNSGAQVLPRIIGCTFRDNFCGNDGGAISATPTGIGTLLAPLIDSCLFINNRARDRGGAIWYRMSSEGNSEVMIRNSQFIENSAGGQAGAIFARSSFDNVSNDTIMNCLFSLNNSDGSSDFNDGEGGAVFLRGSQDGIRNHHIINCSFDRNTASHRGGAIGTTSISSSAGTCSTNIINCTFAGNTTLGDGGAVHAEASEGTNTMTITNSIFWQDTALVAGNEIFNNGASISLSYSNIEGGVPAGVTDGGNNLDLDPQFGDAENGDLRLTGCSPLINVGNNGVLPANVTTDLDGKSRIHEGTVDLGAYETGIIYVDLTATGVNNGRSWADAFTDFRDALDVALSGNQIWVAQGTYYPTSCNPCSDADKEIALNLVNNVEVYGGFSGSETQLEQRDWVNNLTIFSGDIGVPLDSLDNAYRVLIAENSSDKTILDGFIIEEGNADGSFGFSSGGGLWIDANPGGKGDIQVRNCTFRNNYGGGGGAIAIDCVLGGVSKALIRDCLFEGNTASLRVTSTGAAIFMQGNSGAQVLPKIINCTFRNNFCGNDGGAISATPTGEGTLLAPLIDSCMFSNNRARDRGGAIWYRMSSEGNSTVVIRNSQFSNNTSGGQGGAIFARSSFDNVSNDTIINCLFSLNNSDGSSDFNDGEGGAIFMRGSQDGTRNHQIINSVFDRNSASNRGGAIGTTSFSSSGGTINTNIVNCTFFGNNTQGEGGALHAEGTEGMNTMTLTNNIFWNDTAEVAGNELFNNGATITLSHSDIDGGTPNDITDGGNNISLDPQFLDPVNENLRLSSCSPAVDAGLNTAVPIDRIDMDNDGNTAEQIDIDIEGESRVFEGTVDMGAYEWNGSPPAMSISLDTTDVTCNGLCDGAATVQASGGVPNYSFLWSDGQNTATATGLCAGTYYVTISDTFSCELVDSVIISESPLLTISLNADTTVCPGDTLTLAATGMGGDDNYTFTWDNGLGNGATQEITPTNTTTYTVTLTDGNNCTIEDLVTITVLESPMLNITGSTSFCPGGSTTLDGGAGFSEYLWSEGTMTQTLTVMAAGTYGLAVTDANGCTAIAEVMVTESAGLQPNISGDLAFCMDSMTVLNTGIFSTYLWSTGDTTQHTFVAEAGEISVTVSDESGCMGTASVNVEEIPSPNVQITVSPTFCPGGTTFLDGGAGFSSYLWSDGSMNQTLAATTAGVYGLTVTDASGCSGSTEVTIVENEPLDPGISGDLFFCTDSTTILSATLFEAYFWTTGDTTQQISVSESGEYGVTVVDGNGCTGTEIVMVEEAPNPTVQITGSTTFCPGSSTTLDAGMDFSQYLWSDGTMTQTLTVMTADTYGLTITDTNGCVGTTAITIMESDALEPIISGDLSFCADSMSILDAGVFANYEWTTGDTTQQITVMESGEYGVTVGDGSGCTGTDMVSVDVQANPEPQIMGSATFCPGNATTLDGGAGFSNYLWSDGSMTQTLTVMTADTYGLTVTDVNGCAGITEISIIESEELAPMISGDLSFCMDSLTVLGAGVFAAYEWSTGDTTQQITVMASGEYGVTVNDGNGCSGETIVTVTENVGPMPQITGSTTFCAGSSTTLTGSPDFSTYRWSDGTTTPTLVVMAPGLFSLTVTDDNGCTGTTEIMVSESEELEPSISGNLFFCMDSSTVLDAGLFATYAWTTGDTTQQIIIADIGEYGVTVSDGMNCIGTATARVEALFSPVANNDDFTIRPDDNRTAVFNILQNDITGGSDLLNVTILSPPDIGQIENLENGLLTYTAPEGASGETMIKYELCNLECSNLCSEATVLINLEKETAEVIPNGFTPNGDGHNDTFVFDRINTSDPEEIPDNELIVYNRWGDIVYRQKPYDNTWDGANQNGQELPEATYYYILYLDIGEGVILRGDVTIIR